MCQLGFPNAELPQCLLTLACGAGGGSPGWTRESKDSAKQGMCGDIMAVRKRMHVGASWLYVNQGMWHITTACEARHVGGQHSTILHNTERNKIALPTL